MLSEDIIRYCAPTMACLKTGSMFNCLCSDLQEMLDNMRAVNCQLREKGLRILPLRFKDGRALIYVYRPEMLANDLMSPMAERLLCECGYTCGNPSLCIAQLMRRLRENPDFPHEIGLFLGYPPADVDGFMHRKDEWKICGLWKVYDDVDAASRQFMRCRRCTQEYVRRFEQGCSLDSLAVAS
ncbi:MAG: DUF3793 family protein [Clostridia bacterium]|nr:DUF3793 family protein [Clostridia bacterium]